MNGIHDMGGMDGFGRVKPKRNEPVFHHEWERRVLGMLFAISGRLQNLDAFRHAIERMEPARYLRTSYYEHWLHGLETRLVESALVSADELRALGARPAKQAPAKTLPGPAFESAHDSSPRFKAGDRVVARNLNPVGHTRLPRYVRGKRGAVERDHGAYVFPDTHAHDLGDSRQHVYSVRFEARELWGDRASARDLLYIDLWEDYLEKDYLESAGEHR